jgi:hypothetical protein
MIRTSTVVYVVLLLALVGAYFYLRDRQQPAEIELTAEPTEEVSYLFLAEEGIPSGIRIEAKTGEAVEVARDAGNAWVIREPVEAPADQGAAEAAASQITAMRILDRVPDIDPAIVGLEEPAYVLKLKFEEGGERTVDVGMLTPSETGYYVRDPLSNVVIVSRSAIEALVGLLENPPYLETPSPADATPTP